MNALFGTAVRSRVLCAIALLERTYAGELISIVQGSPASVVSLVDQLVSEGILSVREEAGRNIVRFNLRFPRMKEFVAFLRRYALATDVPQRIKQYHESPRGKRLGTGAHARSRARKASAQAPRRAPQRAPRRRRAR